MASDPTTIHLGARDYSLVPQRTGRIARKLRLLAEVFSVDSPPDEVTGGFYDALKVFIPDLAPEYELAGYTREGYEEKRRHEQAVAEARRAHAELVEGERQGYISARGADSWADLGLAERIAFAPTPFKNPEPDWSDPYDENEAADKSPTFPEIADAVEAIYEVNGGKRLERLLANLVDPGIVKILTTNAIKGWVSTLSQSAPSPSGASLPTISGTASPTPEPSRPEIPPPPVGSPATTPEATSPAESVA